MKKLIFLLILTTLTLAACQGTDREIVRDRITGTGPGGPDPGAPQIGDTDPLESGVGGVDSGGGNGYDRRMLESYLLDVRSLTPYQQLVLPILRNLAQNHARLASDLLHIAIERGWGFIPGKLETIPSARIGMSIRTEQYALQSRKEIWVNKLLFDDMASEDERAKLILHELVMGVRLMKYQDEYDDCLSATALGSWGQTKEEQAKYRQNRRFCDKQAERRMGINILGQKFELSRDVDYPLIRELTYRLWASGGQMDAEELTSWLRINKFRTYRGN